MPAKLSVGRPLESYHFPFTPKLIEIIQNCYKDSRCAVRADGHLGEWFTTVTGVKQECLLSPSIFIIVMDWILKRATDENELGLKRLEEERLMDLDFADDIALFDNKYAGLQRLTNRVEEEAKDSPTELKKRPKHKRR